MLLLSVYLTGKEIDANCLVDQHGCTIIHQGNTIGQFSFNVEDNARVQLFRAEFIAASAVDTASVEISGVNYYMGFNRYSMKQTGRKFVYSGILPGCIYRDMHWRARVIVFKGNVTYYADYNFHIRRNLDDLT